MRITLEPTTPPRTGLEANEVNHKVVIEHPHDELNIDETIRLISTAVVAYGFHEDAVVNYFKEVANG